VAGAALGGGAESCESGEPAADVVYQMNFTGQADGRCTPSTFRLCSTILRWPEADWERAGAVGGGEYAGGGDVADADYVWKDGNPNGDDKAKWPTQDGALPYWPAYDLKNRSTMMWERRPRVENDPRGAERVFAEKAHYHQAGTPLP